MTLWPLVLAVSSTLGQVIAANEAKPAAAATVATPAPAPAATATTPPAPAAPTTPVADAPATPVADVTAPAWYDRLTPHGFARIGLFYSFPLQEEQLIGSNGGFRMAAIRLGADYKLSDKFNMAVSIEAAAPIRSPGDASSGTRVVELRDAYFEYAHCDCFQVRAGQFKAPFSAETLAGDETLVFISRSVASEGVAPPEAYGPTSGLSLGRQVGVQVSSHFLGSDVFAFRYAVGVFNGSGQNQLFNDNNIVMPVARVEAKLFERFTVGANGAFNIKAEGTRPNRVSVSQFSYGADLTLKIPEVDIDGMFGFLSRSSTYNTSVAPADAAWGLYAQLHYLHPGTGLEAGVRFSMYDPSFVAPDDTVNEIAAMVGWRATKWFKVLLQYTHRGEEPLASLPNDSADVLAQVAW